MALPGVSAQVASFVEGAVRVSRVRPPPDFPLPTPDQQLDCRLARESFSERTVLPFLPREYFENEPAGDFRRAWYSNTLCVMGEPPLSSPPPGGRKVRFLWLRSFHPAIVVHVEKDRGKTLLVARETDRPSGGRIVREQERVLSDVQTDAISSLLDEIEFWTLPPTKQSFGLDGAEWILEVSDPTRYHFVDRWGGGELETIGRRLLELSEMEPDPIY